MNPMAKARGLQLARNDKAAAYGCMTSARQGRNPAACASSEAWMRNRGLNPSVDVGHFTLATFPASNPSNVQLARCGANRCPRHAGVPKHASSVPQHRGGGAYPMPKGRGLRAGER
jgi:TPR repeat protein